MKLGICCVYFYGEDGDWLMDLQLKFIAKTLRGYDYTVYAAAPRLQPHLRERLASTPHVEILDLPLFPDAGKIGTGQYEHAHYLDRLVEIAASQCTHVTLLDSDSFPVLDDWPKILLHKMNGLRLAAVLRAENGDTHLPHPCGTFMESSFFTERRPMLLPPEEEVREFTQSTGQRIDTGIGYGDVLWRTNEDWLKIRRSNAIDPHFLMAGIYGDVFFHLGASSRRPIFYTDYVTRPLLRFSITLSKMPMLWRLSPLIEDRYIAENSLIFQKIAAALKSSPDDYLALIREGHLHQPRSLFRLEMIHAIGAIAAAAPIPFRRFMAPRKNCDGTTLPPPLPLPQRANTPPVAPVPVGNVDGIAKLPCAE